MLRVVFVHAAACHHVPTTCLVCAVGRSTPPDRQREFAGRATRIVELDALSRPADFYPAKSGSGRPLTPGRTANTLPDSG